MHIHTTGQRLIKTCQRTLPGRSIFSCPQNAVRRANARSGQAAKPFSRLTVSTSHPLSCLSRKANLHLPVFTSSLDYAFEMMPFIQCSFSAHVNLPFLACSIDHSLMSYGILRRHCVNSGKTASQISKFVTQHFAVGLCQWI